MQPTEEQAEAVSLFMAGDNLAVEAGAGTGKTSTLVLMAEATRDRGQYVAFNRPIVNDAAAKMPENVAASTAHALAMRAVGNRFRRRLGGARIRSDEIGRMLRMDPFVVTYGQERKVLAAGFMAGLVMRSIRNFCASADADPGPEHVPYIPGIDAPTPTGPGWTNNNLLRQRITPKLAEAWRDLTDPTGSLPYIHDHYLKLWERSNPRIPGEFILFDEAQDASPVMLSIVQQQADAQVVYVGDSQQQIYEWRGAVNALDNVDADHRTFLTRSFRFGPAIADVANEILSILDAPLRLTGHDEIPSLLASVGDSADAILTRSNARAVQVVMEQQKLGRRPYLVGGGTEVASFARGAKELQEMGYTGHPDLACFTSWKQVLEYVDQDPQGDELMLLCRLVETFGVNAILQALDRIGPEDGTADVIVSTAHKAKGREWPRLRIEDDFPPEVDSAGEWRLLYVAATRARNVLDLDACAPLVDLLDLKPKEAPCLTL